MVDRGNCAARFIYKVWGYRHSPWG